MAEAIIVLGVLSSVITCIEVGMKVSERLEYYLSRTKSPPQIFLTLNDTIPLLIETFEKIKTACEEGRLDEQSQKRLSKTVDGCIRLTRLLEEYLDECLPVPEDGFSQKAKKAIKSIRSEKYIAEIQRTLETYKSTLTLYFTHFVMTAPEEEYLETIPQDRHYVVPARNVQHFIGRVGLLERMSSALTISDDDNDRAKVLILRGMGGCGKTQLALEFCRKERAKCSVFWVDATAPGTAARSFEDIGTVLAPGTNFPNPEAARNFVLKHLEASTEPLLFVFDNYDQPGEFPNVRDFFPHRAHIIFTSRHVDSKRLGTTIEIGAMPVDEAVELLLIQSGLEKTPENIKHAQSISEELGGLALAIDQAATYISARSVPLHSFNDVYARRKAAILKHTPTHWEYRKVGSGETEQSLSVFTTWEMSFEQLEARGQDRESIIHLLTLGAFIDTNNIGEGLFSLYSQQEDRPGWLSTFMADEEWDSDFYQDTVVRLLSVSLVTSIDLTSEDARFSFHPLIAEWLKLRIDAKERAEFCEEAIRVVRLFVDNGDKKEMPIRYKGETLSHMDKIMEHARAYKSAKFESNALKDATISFGSFYRRLGRYQETQTLVERAMSDESDVNPAIRNILANMYCDQGELQKSEALYFKVLTGLDHPTPEKDPGYTLLWTNQAFIYWTQDDKLRADGLAYEGAYKGDFTAFDPWYVSVLSTYNGLGVLYMKTGHLDLAEDFFTKALSGREKTMGRDDRYTAEIVNHLGALYTRLGQLDKAETLLLRALAYLDKAYGEFYMATQPTANNLGLLYLTQGRLDDAERIIHRTTGYLERGFGPTHASTLCAFHNQALLLRRLGRPNEARRLLERTIEGWEDSGEGIAKMEADSKYILADIVLSLDESKAGTSHGNTKIETGDIVDDHTKEEKKKKTGKQRAGELFHQAAELYGIALGKTHPQTVDAWNRANEIGVGDVTLSSPL